MLLADDHAWALLWRNQKGILSVLVMFEDKVNLFLLHLKAGCQEECAAFCLLLSVVRHCSNSAIFSNAVECSCYMAV